MSKWVQNNDANWRVPYTGGWCLKYVEDAFGTAHLYPDATNAWANAQKKHTDLPPAGITVPVYFSLGSTPQGHIAIRLDDLTVASSTQSGTHPQGYLHPNIQDLINIYGKYNSGCQYLGWSEDLAGTTLVTFVSDPVIQLATESEVRQAYLDILHREADADGIAHYMQYTIDFVRNDLMNSAERKTLEANIAAQQAADLAAQQAAIIAKAQADAKAAQEAAAAKAAQDAIDAAKAAEAASLAAAEAAKPVVSPVEVSVVPTTPVVIPPVVTPTPVNPDPVTPIQHVPTVVAVKPSLFQVILNFIKWLLRIKS